MFKDLTIRYVKQGSQYAAEPPATGYFQDYSQRTLSYDTDSRAVAPEALDTYQRDMTQPAPVNYSRPTTEELDMYIVPADPAAPGYDAAAVGKTRRVFHNGTGGLNFADSDAATMCDIAVSGAQGTAPTSVGGYGFFQFDVTTSAATVAVALRLNKVLIPFLSNAAPGRQYIYNRPPGTYVVAVTDSKGCALPEFEVVVPPFVRLGCTDSSANNYDPLATDDDGTCTFDPTSWDAVGGLRTLPVWLPTPVALLTDAGAVRVGLYVEAELFREGAAAPFAKLRKQVRVTAEQVNAAPYLALPLQAVQQYAPRVGAQLDTDAFLAYSYRYRAVDDAGPGLWSDRPRLRYAVLAAPADDDTNLRPYLGSPEGAQGQPLSAFRVPVHFVTLPLETTLLLPPRAAGVTLYVQLRYLAADGGQLEIRTVPVPDTMPAGVLRVALPDNPLPCATSVQVALVDEDTATPPGTCPTGPAPEIPDGLLIVNDRYLKL